MDDQTARTVRNNNNFTINGAITTSGGANLSANQFINSTVNLRWNSQDENDSFQPWTVPRPVSPLFTGREDVLQRLADAFAPREANDRDSPRRAVISGLGGMGKSELCIRFAHDQRDRYWGTFWIDLTSSQTAEQSFKHIAEICNVPNTSVPAVKNWLSSTKKPWLLIIDNADDLNLDLRVYQPSSSKGDVVVNTRNPGIAKRTDSLHERLDSLPKDLAVQLLLSACEEPESETSIADAELVVNLLGGHTLAIRHAGAYIKEGHCLLSEYAEVFEASQLELLQFEDEEEPSQYRSIHLTLQISVQRLEKFSVGGDRSASDALQLLKIYAFLHHEGLMTHILSMATRKAAEMLTRIGSTDLTISALRAPHAELCFQIDEPRLRRSHRLLSSLSLISVHGRGHEEFMQMHPVVHGWARERLSREERAESLRQALVAVIVWKEMSAPGSRSEMRYHIFALAENDLRVLYEDIDALLITPFLIRLSTWLTVCNNFKRATEISDLIFRAHRNVSADWTWRPSAASRAVLQDMHPERNYDTPIIFHIDPADATLDLLIIAGQMAILSENHLEIVRVHEEVLAGIPQLYTAAPITVLTARIALSHGYCGLGRYEEAIAVSQQCLSEYQSLSESENIGPAPSWFELLLYCGLATACELGGHLDESETYLNSLHSLPDVLGDVQVFSWFNQLATALISNDEPGQALKALQHGFWDSSKAWVPSQSLQLTLVRAYIEDRKYDEAVTYVRNLLQQPEFRLYSAHAVLAFGHELGLALLCTGQVKAAISVLESVSDEQHVFDPDERKDSPSIQVLEIARERLDADTARKVKSTEDESPDSTQFDRPVYEFYTAKLHHPYALPGGLQIWETSHDGPSINLQWTFE